MNWRTSLSIVLLVALLIFGWSAWDNRKKPQFTGEVTPSDYIMRDFEMIALNQEGTESLALRAPEMHRTTADQTFSITEPLFLMPDNNGHYWEVRSKSAHITAKGEKVTLIDDVVAKSSPDAATVSTFKTSRLDIFPDTHLAKTNQPVTLSQPGITLQGTGFEINSQTQQYKFMSKVKSRYVPQPTQ